MLERKLCPRDDASYPDGGCAGEGDPFSLDEERPLTARRRNPFRSSAEALWSAKWHRAYAAWENYNL